MLNETKLLEFRTKKGASIYEVANYCLIDIFTYEEMESGKRIVSADVIAKLCEFYCCEPNELI